MILLHGDVALVTGCGTGIGRSIAIALAECGAEIVIASRSRAHLDEGSRAAWTTGITLDVNGGQHLAGDMWAIDPDAE